jgi:hypothetical protein
MAKATAARGIIYDRDIFIVQAAAYIINYNCKL